jgi:hypothetical protein
MYDRVGIYCIVDRRFNPLRSALPAHRTPRHKASQPAAGRRAGAGGRPGRVRRVGRRGPPHRCCGHACLPRARGCRHRRQVHWGGNPIINYLFRRCKFVLGPRYTGYATVRIDAKRAAKCPRSHTLSRAETVEQGLAVGCN